MPCLSKVLYLCTNCYYYNLYFSAREWWQFSINCILHSIKERNMRQTWTFAAKRAHDMVKYVNIYTKHLVSATTAEPALKVTHTLYSAMNYIIAACVAGAKRGGGWGREKKSSPQYPSIPFLLLPYPTGHRLGSLRYSTVAAAKAFL